MVGYVVLKFSEEARAGEKIGSYIRSLHFKLNLLFLVPSTLGRISGVLMFNNDITPFSSTRLLSTVYLPFL